MPILQEAVANDIEACIRDAFKDHEAPYAYMNISGPLVPQTPGEQLPGVLLSFRDAAQMALWHLERAKEVVNQAVGLHAERNFAYHVGVAAALVFPYGVDCDAVGIAGRYPPLNPLQASRAAQAYTSGTMPGSTIDKTV